MSERLKGSLAPKTPRLRGKLLDAIAKGEAPKPARRLFPEGYEVPNNVREQVAKRRADPSLVPYEDPTGVLVPGRTFTSAANPGQRVLLAAIYKNPRGDEIAAMHIEGEQALRNYRVDAIRQKMDEGLTAIPFPDEKL